MSGRWAGLGLAYFGVVCLSACIDNISELDLTESPTSEVVLQIDAGREVARLTSVLRVQFSALPSLPAPTSAADPQDLEIGKAQRSIDYTNVDWPLAVSIPEDVLAQGDAFWVEVSALDQKGRSLAAVRLISAQQPGRVLEPQLMLSDVCLDVICGARTSTCSDQGFCSRAVRAPEGLPSRPIGE